MANFSSTYPATKPVFQADFANGGRIDPRATFSRSDTPPTYAAPSAVHYWSNEKHLSSENLLLQSQTLDTTWAAVDVADPTGSQTAPDGTSTAWLLTADSASSQTPYVRQSPTFSGSTQYTMVGHLKAGTASHGYISFRTQNGYSAYALLDFSGGTVSHAGFGDFTGVTSSVTALGSSWFKVTLTATTGTNLSGSNVLVGISDGTTPVGAGYATWNSAGETMYAWGIQLATTNAKVYDSPSTTQIARSYAPTLKSVATAGAARFEYDPTDGQSEGILIEGQSTNLLKESTDFSGSWQIINATKSLEAIAPNGALNAIAFREGTNSDQKRLLRYFDNAGPNLTISIYAKLLGNTRRLVIREANATGATAWFDLVSATASSSGVIQSVGGGWYRCSLTIASSSTPMAAGFYIVPANGTLYTDSQFAGDGYSGLLLGMPQAEQQSFSSSWISTTSSTATRASDSLSVATADIPGFSEGVGTIVCETGGVASSTAVNQLAFGLNGPASSNLFSAGVNNGGVTDSTVRVYSQTPDGDQAFLNPGTATVGTGYKLAVRYELDNIAASMNGGAVVSDTNGKVPVGIDTLWVGELEGNYHLNSNLKRIAVYNEALSDTNLISLTS